LYTRAEKGSFELPLVTKAFPQAPPWSRSSKRLEFALRTDALFLNQYNQPAAVKSNKLLIVL
jgi:hypothetical protein